MQPNRLHAFLLALALTWAGQAAADSAEQFDRGLLAAEQGDYQHAIQYWAPCSCTAAPAANRTRRPPWNGIGVPPKTVTPWPRATWPPAIWKAGSACPRTPSGPVTGNDAWVIDATCTPTFGGRAPAGALSFAQVVGRLWTWSSWAWP